MRTVHQGRKKQFVSLAGVLVLAMLLPGVLRLTNSVVRFAVRAEGRLAAIAVETDRVLGPLPAPWKGLAQGADEIKTFMDSAASDIAELKMDYVRIDHIFNEFNVVSKNGGQLVFNWSELDRVVGQIVAAGATPFFSLSYMPPAISMGGILDEPKDWNDWATVVQKTIEHYSGDLKLDGVYYEVWNEPDLFGDWKMGGKKDYRQLYKYAALGAERAKVTQRYKLGGPATTGLYRNWLDNFFPFVLQNNLRLDFFSWHRYDLDLGKYAQDVEMVDAWLERHPHFSTVEKIVSEFGPRSEPGGENDSKVGAAHLVAVMREFLPKVKAGFSFSVTGSWGVIGKPRHGALKMLAALGDQRLAITGEGSRVKAIGALNKNKYQVILANYDPKQKYSEVVPVTFINLKDRRFKLRRTVLGGQMREEKVATTEAILQRLVPMTPNSVVLLELEPEGSVN